MNPQPILISTGNLTPRALAGQVAVVTGAGGGIGFEAARALVWLGAQVVIAEIDAKKGNAAEKAIRKEFGEGTVLFIQTDVGDERSVKNLAARAVRWFDKVDIVLNNATYAPLGAVTERSIKDWDASYRVNLRGPVLLAQAFLPAMIERNQGIFVCVSSAGGPYMGAYETLKSAQVELANTLDGELEGKNVLAFSIGPGIVPTETMQAGVAQIASRYGQTPEEFTASYHEQYLSVEAAGAGFAACIAYAHNYRGIETYSAAGLIAAGIEYRQGAQAAPAALVAQEAPLTDEQAAEALRLCRVVVTTLKNEHQGWLKRPMFEKQWMLRDFKQHAGLPVEQALAELQALQDCLVQKETGSLRSYAATARRIDRYFEHYQTLTRGALKDAQKVDELTGMMQSWRESAQSLEKILAG